MVGRSMCSEKKRASLFGFIMPTLAMLLALVTSVEAQSVEKVLAHLGPTAGGGGLTFDTNGNLYGTIAGHQFGSVFKLKPYKDGRWSFTSLYRFTGGLDGTFPQSDLIFDNQGNLYGSTIAGGASQLSLQ